MQLDQKTYKTQSLFLLKHTFTVTVFLLFFYAVLAWIFDPLQIFHKSFFYTDRLNTSMREQAAGIINNFGIDSIILGTSMLENTSASEASSKIGGKFFNISAGGATPYERHFVLEHALRKGIKNVIYSLDYTQIINMRRLDRGDYPPERYCFLYDDSQLNDIKIYFAKKFLFKLNKYHTKKRDFDYSDRYPPQMLYNGLLGWVGSMNSNNDIKHFFDKDVPFVLKTTIRKRHPTQKNVSINKNMLIYMDDYIIKYVREYPNVNFYFIFPPYFRYTFACWIAFLYDTYTLHDKCIQHFVEESKKYTNMHIFGFEDMDFLDCISNYRDTRNYHNKFNSFFLDCIRDRTHMLTPDNVEKYLLESKKKAENFDIFAFCNEADALIKAQEKQPKALGHSGP